MRLFFSKTQISIVIAIFLVLAGGPLGPSRAAAKPADSEQAQRKELEKNAKSSFRHLQRAIKKNGFYNARAALNIWRSDAVDAGTFDPALYEHIKRELYLSSIENNRGWFNEYLLRKNFRDAKICLEIWRLHAQVINVFDEQQYDRMHKQLQTAIAKAKSRAAEKRAAAAKFSKAKAAKAFPAGQSQKP